VASAGTRRARDARWRAAADILAEVRRRPGVTRAEVARLLDITSGSATEIAARLRDLRLLSEAPAPPRGRGRPTSVLEAHPDGPLVLAADLRQEDWRCAIASLDGRIRLVGSGRHRSRRPDSVLAAMRAAVDAARRRHGRRLRAVSLAVAGTVRDDRLVQASTLGWGAVDLTALTAGTQLPLLIGNDATLAGVAEARTGAASGARTVLHLLVEVGIGGALVLDGTPFTGARGSAGEYGHLPLGDRARRCPCGARGCWDLEVDGRGLAHRLGEPAPADPRTYARRVIDRAATDPTAAKAVAAVVTALGSGVAGLVNADDPDVVTLGGLAVSLRAAAGRSFDAAYAAGLMTFRRAQPPPVVDAAHGDDGALHGAAAVGLDDITSEAALAAWAERVRRA
jgi:predicted NBD/HSP70 family sugar kinase